MHKKIFAFLLISALCTVSFVSCKRNPPDSSSKIPLSSDVSSQITSSDASSSGNQIGVEAENSFFVKRNSFMSVDKNGDFFYCAASGGIYKQLADSNNVSKIYSSSGYTFFSVDCFEQDKICVGFTSSKFKSNYIIFNLKDKTVTNAVSGEEFEQLDIYSLVHHEGALYFLAKPDRYNRFTLYRQDAQVTRALADGVNEFFIWGKELVYNIGNEIYFLNLEDQTSQPEMGCKAEYSYISGFTIAGDNLFYSTDSNTYFTKFVSGNYSVLPSHINVWTQTKNETHAFFCGALGGIYAFELETGTLSKISQYTASDIKCIGDYLYLYPANAKDYPEVEKSFIVSGGIYRFEISDLINQVQADSSIPSVSSLAQSETESSLTSSELSQIEAPPPAPERFGR